MVSGGFATDSIAESIAGSMTDSIADSTAGSVTDSIAESIAGSVTDSIVASRDGSCLNHLWSWSSNSMDSSISIFIPAFFIKLSQTYKNQKKKKKNTNVSIITRKWKFDNI